MGADLVAADIVRHVGYLLHHDDVARVEIVVSPKVASVLLSARRRHLNAIEERLGKGLDVRVSEAIAIDRVDYYAYDRRNSDLDLNKLSSKSAPTIDELENDPDEMESSGGQGRSRRRRRRRGSAPAADATAVALSGELAKELEEIDRQEEAEAKEAAKKKKTRSRRSSSQKPTDSEPAEPIKPVRLYVLAKELGNTAKDIIGKFNELEEDARGDLELKSHMSMVTGDQVKIIKSWFNPEPAEDEEEAKPRRRRRRRGGRGRRGRGRWCGGQSIRFERRGRDQDRFRCRGGRLVGGVPEDSAPRKKRRSRRRRGKSTDGDESVSANPEEQVDSDSRESSEEQSQGTTKKRRRRRRRRSGGSGSTSESSEVQQNAEGDAGSMEPKPAKKAARKTSKKKTTVSKSDGDSVENPPASEEAKPKPRRRLYGSRRGISAIDTQSRAEDRE